MSTTTLTVTPNPKPATSVDNKETGEKPKEPKEPFKQKTPEQIIIGSLAHQKDDIIEDIGFNESTKKTVPITEINVLKHSASSDPDIGSFLASVLEAPGSFQKKIPNATIYYIKKNDYQTFSKTFRSIVNPSISSITSQKGYAIRNITYKDILTTYTGKDVHLTNNPDSDTASKIYPLNGTNQTTRIEINLEPQVKKAKEEAAAAAQVEVDKLKADAASAKAAAEAARLKAEADIARTNAELAELKAKLASQTLVSSAAASTAEEAGRKAKEEADRIAKAATEALALAEKKDREAESAAAAVVALATKPDASSGTPSLEEVLKTNHMIAIVIPEILKFSSTISSNIDSIKVEWETNCTNTLKLLNPKDDNDDYKQLIAVHTESIISEIDFKKATNADPKKEKDETKLLETTKNEKRALSTTKDTEIKDLINLIGIKNSKITDLFESLVTDQERLIIGLDGSIDWETLRPEIESFKKETEGKIDAFNSKNTDLVKKIISYYYSIKDHLKLEEFIKLLEGFTTTEFVTKISNLNTSYQGLIGLYAKVLPTFTAYNKDDTTKTDDNLKNLISHLVEYYKAIKVGGTSNHSDNLSELNNAISLNDVILNNINDNSYLLPNKKDKKEKIVDVKFLEKNPLKKLFNTSNLDNSRNIELIRKILGNLIKYINTLSDEKKPKTSEYLTLKDNESIITEIMTSEKDYTTPQLDEILKLIQELQQLLKEENQKIKGIHSKEFDEKNDKSFLSKFNKLRETCEAELKGYNIGNRFTEIEGMKDALTVPLEEETTNLKEYADKVKQMAEFAKQSAKITSIPPGINELLEKLKEELKQKFTEYRDTWNPKEKEEKWDKLKKVLDKIKPYDTELSSLKTLLPIIEDLRIKADVKFNELKPIVKEQLEKDTKYTTLSPTEQNKKLNSEVRNHLDFKSISTQITEQMKKVEGILKVDSPTRGGPSKGPSKKP